MRMKLTLVSESVAKKGYVFTMLGEAEECQQCKFRKVCIENLEVGTTYRVTNVRPKKKHECLLLPQNEKVVVVEVEPTTVVICVKAKNILPGISVQFEPQKDCGVITCPHWEHCNPVAISEGTKITILDVLEKKVECKIGRELSAVSSVLK